MTSQHFFFPTMDELVRLSYRHKNTVIWFNTLAEEKPPSERTKTEQLLVVVRADEFHLHQQRLRLHKHKVNLYRLTLGEFDLLPSVPLISDLVFAAIDVSASVKLLWNELLFLFASSPPVLGHHKLILFIDITVLLDTPKLQDDGFIVEMIHLEKQRRKPLDRVDELVELEYYLVQPLRYSSNPGEGSGGFREAQCAICLQQFEVGKVVIRIRCSHHFHDHCLSKWLAMNPICPLCRHPVCL